MLRFLSVCSGIEAASVAFAAFGWQPVAFSEIEPFPCALLAHHYPAVPNLGDLTRFMDWPEELLMEVDILVGGTPCQAFSIAGLRLSLKDERGNLTLIFVLLYAHICKIRHAAGRPAPLFLWENVPGVLTAEDNAFGCFLAGLAGENGALRPPGGKWLDAGYVRGPAARIAWRILDAQYCGLAQRRERVFALGSADPSFDPAAVLFEFDGLRRDSPPRREAGQGSPAGTLRSTDGGFHLDHACANHLIGTVAAPLTTNAYADNASEESKLIPETAWAIQARDSKGPDDVDTCTSLIPEVAHALRAEGFDASEDGTGRGTPIVPEHVGLDLFNGLLTGPVAATLGARGSHASAAGPTVLSPIPFDTTQITSAANRSQPKSGDPCHPLASAAHPPAIAFSGRMRGDDGRGYDRPPLVFGEDVVGAIDTIKPHCVAFPERLSGTQCANTQDLAPVLQAENPTAVAFQERGRTGGRSVESQGDLAYCLTAPKGGGRRQEMNVAVQEAVSFKPRHYRLPGKDGAAADIPGALTSNAEHAGDCSPHVSYLQDTAWRVRRLTPEECELLQGFPMGYTLMRGWKGKKRQDEDLAETIAYLVSLGATETYAREIAYSPDGPRYKALGNSWAVTVVRWIGQRIHTAIQTQKAS